MILKETCMSVIGSARLVPATRLVGYNVFVLEGAEEESVRSATRSIRDHLKE